MKIRDYNAFEPTPTETPKNRGRKNGFKMKQTPNVFATFKRGDANNETAQPPTPHRPNAVYIRNGKKPRRGKRRKAMHGKGSAKFREGARRIKDAKRQAIKRASAKYAGFRKCRVSRFTNPDHPTEYPNPRRPTK